MKKELILQRLQATIDKLKTLKEEQFDNTDIVTHLDKKNPSKSICDVMGWYPIWFAELNIRYVRRKFCGEVFINICSEVNEGSVLEGEAFLQYYHGLSSELLCVLFYGSSMPEHSICNSLEAPLSVVIEVWERVLALLTNDEIEPNH